MAGEASAHETTPGGVEYARVVPRIFSSGYYGDRAAARRDALQLLAESSRRWADFAARRRLRFTAVDGMPSLEGRIEAFDVVVAASGSPDAGFRTRASTTAKHPLAGTLHVGPPGSWDDFVAQIKPRRAFGEPQLDALLVVESSPPVLAGTILDGRVMALVRHFARQNLSLSYAEGAIAIEWAGVERDEATLDGVLDALVDLGLRGNDAAPYR